MTDANVAPTQSDLLAQFKIQLERQDAEAPGAEVDDTAEIGEDEAETDISPDLEADEAPAGDEITEGEAEPGEAATSDNLEPTIQPPLGLTADEQAAFAQADPELQKFLVRQEAHQRVDYTAKTEQLAAERREFEARAAEVARQREQYAQLLQGVADRELKPPPAALAQEDPDEYQVQRARYEEARDLNDAASRELTRVQAEQTAQMQQERTAHEARVRAELPSLIPEMADATKADAHRREMTALALANGIPKAALANARAGEWKVLDLAVKGLKAEQAERAKGRKAAPKAQRPGAASRPGDKRQSAKARVSQAIARTEETGDFSHMFKARLEAESK